MINGINLFDFQQDTVTKIIEKTLSVSSKQTVVVKSPTGSGKTIILIDYIDEYLELEPNAAFVWLCPGKGDLEEQSRRKMLKYVPDRTAQNLDDALTGGFIAGSTTFINWEKITKKGNNAIKDSEKQNLFDQIRRAERDGTKFIVIIDEEHSNNTAKAKEVIDAFHARNIIRVSATTTKSDKCEFIEIDENDVIASGLITRAIYINEGIEDDPDDDEGAELLLSRADVMRKKIFDKYLSLGKTIRPLVLIQFPNGKPETIDEVERLLEDMGYTYENHMVAKWMSDDKRQLDESIVENDGEPIFLLMKQAISTGWDCPRAKILVKLREGMSEQFTIQTIGRIRRMPEAKHYDEDILDCCYVYTFDESYKQGLLSDIERSYEKRHLYLKDKAKTFTLKRQNRDLDYSGLGEREVLERIYNYYITVYNLTEDKELNKQKLEEKAGYIFGDHIYGKFLQGRFVTLGSIDSADMLQRSTKIDTHTHGFRMLDATNKLKTILSLQQYQVRAILERLFQSGNRSKYNLLQLSKEELYAFSINNQHQLMQEFRSVASEISNVQASLNLNIREEEFKIPIDDYLNYDPTAKKEIDYLANAYEKYTSGFATLKLRSRSENMFERWCETRQDIDWVYKNGDSGQNYMSIVYITGSGKQRLFYPDYIIKKIDGTVWLIEAKGGEDAEGNSQNIDDQAQNKFNYLKNYAEARNLHWGFIRNYDGELYLNNTEWHEEMSDNHWVNLDQTF